MKKKFLSRTVATCLCLAAPGFLFAPHAQAQSTAASAAAAPLVTLTGNVRPEANATNDRGPVDASTQLDHMLLLMQRPAAKEAALEALIQAQYKAGGPDFHHWLTAKQLGQEYGPSTADIATVQGWLTSYGFKVNSVSTSGIMIDFSGTAGQVDAAFNTAMHNLSVNGVAHIANMKNPAVPSTIAKLIVGVSSLNDFMPQAAHTQVSSAHIDPNSRAVVPSAANGGPKPQLTVSSDEQLVVPDDLHTIYNFTPLYNKGITGKGQTVVVAEPTDVFSLADWSTFRSEFGLTKFPAGKLTQTHPGGCTDPGVNGDDVEAILDAEYSSAAAPGATINLATCASSRTTFGVLIAVNNLINQPIPPPIISISYGECEAGLGAAGNATYNMAYEQAASEGVSVFVSSGDEGAASCDADQPTAQLGLAVSGFTSTAFNMSVGGTDFGDTFAGTNSTYWNTTNNSTFGSAKSYVPEIPWNDSCASTLIANTEGFAVPFGVNGFCNSAAGEQFFITTASGSGGRSNCAFGETSPLPNTAAKSGTCSGYPKPNFQAGIEGNANDGVRDIPDVSLFAANGVWGHFYIFCFSDPTPGRFGVPCVGNPANWTGAGGTSFASPIIAGVQALVNQSTGTVQGNPDFVYYALARKQYAALPNSCISTLGKGVDTQCTFYDVAQGDMDVNCLGNFNCFKPSGTNGVLSQTNKAYQKTFNSGVGWDFATGIGTVNVTNLVNNWNTAF